MKFTFNLGNIEIRQEKMDVVTWNGKNKHVHHTPERAFNLEGLNLEIEIGMEEMLEMVKADKETIGTLISTARELVPQLLAMKNEAKEKEVVDLKNKIYGLEAELSAARSCKEYVKEKYNKIIKETEKKSVSEDDRELY